MTLRRFLCKVGGANQFAGALRRARMALEDWGEVTPCRYTQAGGSDPARSSAFSSGSRSLRMAIAAFETVARRVDPGRAYTAIGISSAIRCQRSQRWNWLRLSAPMIQ